MILNTKTPKMVPLVLEDPQITPQTLNDTSHGLNTGWGGPIYGFVGDLLRDILQI